jgi:hypothetical protein
MATSRAVLGVVETRFYCDADAGESQSGIGGRAYTIDTVEVPRI